MNLAEIRITLEEFRQAIGQFVTDKCEKMGDHLTHKGCGGAIRIGFLNLFYINEDGSLDPGPDGFGIGPERVPYCEKCFPPNGLKYTYAVRFPIARKSDPKRNEQKLIWGNPKLLTEGTTP